MINSGHYQWIGESKVMKTEVFVAHVLNVPCSHSCEHREGTTSVEMSLDAARRSACATSNPT